MNAQDGVVATRGCALIVDDEPNVAELLRDALAAEGFTPVIAPDGLAALRRARQYAPDVIVLDIGLPGLDGFEVCRSLRKETAAPIIVVSARGDEIDKIVGLEIGADDYISKPFSPREFIARLRAILRRSGVEPPTPAKRRTIGDVCVDADRREVTVKGIAVRLKPREFDLLWLFARNEGRVFTRDQLIEAVWGFDFDGDPRTVDVHVRRVRRALSDPATKPRYLHTVHGLGYKFTVPK
ncbi:MAG: response regulator transcription factor [Candidatus Eremiobacteraeota bacterium]|nr:response regulator transcription factor [Candidatus Eremiobacteraeota bacterium]